MDLDHFKQINDTLGHDAGDQALCWLASLLTDVAGEEGLPVRFGGDEFVMLLPRADRKLARLLADRILQRTVDHQFRVRRGECVPITVSIGVASAPDDARNGRTLMKKADTALYHAKESGRNRAVAASDVDQTKVVSRTAIHQLQATGLLIGALGTEQSPELMKELTVLLDRMAKSSLAIRRSPAGEPHLRVGHSAA